MSALPTDIGQSLERLRSRRQYVDGLIAEHRRATPAEALEQRQVERLSIGELTDLNSDQIARRLASMRFDNRSTVEKVIDLIDLPRNQIFNLAAPGIARKKAMQGDFGAAGTPEVTGADVLRELGVDNSVLRGTLGFVADVAFDPLTYVGGGAVKTTLRAGTQGGRRVSLEFGRKGSNALKGGIKAAARGEEVADRTVRNLVETAGFSRERLARLREAGFSEGGIETLIRRRLMGRETPGMLKNRRLAKQNPRLARDAAARRQVFDRPGLIGRRFIDGSTDAATRQGAQTQAAREFVERYGVAARPGVRIGGDRAVQQVAHIPFTDIGVMVPAFSRAGRRASAVRAIAGAAEGSVVGRAILRGQEIVDDLGRLADDSARLGTATASDVARLEDEARAAAQMGDPAAFQRQFDADIARQNLTDELEDIRSRTQALLQEARALEADDAARSIGDSLALSRVRSQIQASAKLTNERLRRLQDAGIDATRLSEGRQRTQRIAAVIDRLEDIGRSSRGAMLPLDEAGRAVVSANPAAVARAVETVRPLLTDLDDALAEVKALQSVARDAKGTPGPLFSRSGLETTDARLAEAQSRAQRIRDDIYDATAALREGPTQTVEEFYEQVQRADAARLGDRIEAWVDAPVGRQEAALREVESLQASIEAAQRVADVADASITRYLDGAEKDIVDAVKVALGTNDDVIGSAGLVDFAKLVTFPLAEDNVVVRGAQAMDRWMAQKFGRRNNMGHEWARFVQRSYREDAQRAFAQTAGSIARAVRDTLKAHNIPPERMDEAMEAATLLLYKRQSAGGRLYQDVWVDGVGPVTVREALEKHPDKVGDNWVVALHRSMNEGMLQDAALRADLEKIADDAGVLFEDLGKLAEDDDMIRYLDGYVPGVLTPEARTTVGASGRNFGQESLSRPLSAQEGFQRPRSTAQYRFQRADGRWVRFFDGDRRYFELPPEQLTPEQRELVDIITEYDGLADPPPGLPTDVFELNDLIGRGKFASITGGAGLNRGFFESNLAALTAHRAGSHLRAMAKRASQDWINTQGVSVDTQALREVFQNPGTPLRLADGRRAVTINPVRGQAAVNIGGQVYRKLDRELVKADNAIGQAIGGAADTRMFPEQIADQIERVAQTVTPESDVWRAYDQILGAWKSSTLLHASWPATEILGNTILATIGGARLDRMVRNAPGVFRAVFWERTPNMAQKAAVTINGRTLTGEELVAGAQALGVTDSSAASELAAMMSANNFIKMPTQGNPLKSARQAATDAAERMLGRAQPGGATAADHPFHEHPMRRLIAPFFRLNQKSNDSMRILAWVSHMEDGMDAASAAQRVKETMFDFGDLTPFESRYMRRMLPFYTWIRNNMAYQAQLVLKRPAIAANYPRAVEAIEQAIAGDAEVPDSMRPRWMRDQLALQIGRDPEKNWSILTRTAVPVGDAYEALSPLAMDQAAMQDFLQLFVGGVSPILKAPFELASGREIFTGREIGGAGFGDMSQQQYLVQQVRWLREFGVGEPGLGALGRASQSGVGGVAGRLLLGGRSQPFTNEALGRQSLREMQDMERQARIAINRAQGAGDNEALERSLANLMNIYRRMRSVGFEDEIPRYARGLLDLAAGGMTDGVE